MPTIPIPTTGGTYDAAGFNDLDANFLERGKLRQVLIRDARGAATDISPHNPDGSLNWSPFASDNTWREDLCAFRFVNGFWVNNTTIPNEGFHIAGAFKEGQGPNSKPTVKNDNFMILQSNFPFDSDLVEEGEPFSFTAVETAKPLIRRLRNNLPLNDTSGAVIVEEPGGLNAGWGRPLDQENIERQVLLVSQFTRNGLPIYTVDGFSLAKLDNLGASKKDKKDSEAAEMSYMPLPDGFFSAMIDGVYRPILKWTWVGGAGWTALGGVPILSTVAPVATATTTGKATIAFADPTGPEAPYTSGITAQSSVSPFTTWTAAVLDTPGAVTSTGGTTTVKVKSVTAGSTEFRCIVTGANGASATTPASNAVTIT